MATVMQTKNDVQADTSAEFKGALSILLPAPIACHAGEIRLLQGPLHPLEARYVEGAVPRRVQEFTAGRTCARAALSALGFRNVAIPVGSRRQPLWPAGIVGSISHAGGYCMAAACSRKHFAGLGVDIEQATPLSDSLVELVSTSRERTWLATQPARVRGLLAKFLFSAKEAVFKCLYPVYGEELEFQDVGLDIQLHQGMFTAHVSRFVFDAASDIEVHGRITCTSRLVFSAAALQDEAARSLELPDESRMIADIDSFARPGVVN